MLYDNILQAVGNTPIIKLEKLSPKNGAQIYAKAEFLNIGGSIKTRSALEMITGAIKRGKIKRGYTVVDASSGNQGVSLALVCARLSLKCVIFMPSSVSDERRKLIEHYGAKVITVGGSNNIATEVKNCLFLAQQMAKEKGVFFCNQFENEDNLLAHYKGTALEIIRDVGEIHGFCAGIGTGGTITGVAKALKEKMADITVWAVEPTNGAILSNKRVKSHLQMGIGDGVIPPILDRNIYKKIVLVSDKKAIYYAKQLAKKEGLACGISSGSNFYGALLLAKFLGKGKKVLTILPDGAERYFSTPLFEKNNNI